MKKLIVTGLAVVISAAAALPALGMFATSHAQAEPGNSGQAEYGTPTGQENAANNPGSDNRSQTAQDNLEGSGDPGGGQENAANNPGSDNRSANAQEQLASE